MRKTTLAAGLCMAVLLPITGTAQVFIRPNPIRRRRPQRQSWQLPGDPVFHAGAFYLSDRPHRILRRQRSVATGTYEGVPLYEDATRPPFTIVYVPIGGNLVRP